MRNLNLIVLIALVLIGLLANYPSLSMAVYGDDWQGVYYYLSRSSNAVHYGFLPGVLAILVPYGTSVFTMGILYQFFGLNQIPYHLVSLMLRIFASYALFLTCQAMINKTNNLQPRRSFIICFLVSLVFLVGLPGIEVTDWLYNMNVYLATGLYLLGIRSQVKFLFSGSQRYEVISVVLSILAIIAAPIRFQAMLILIPLIDTVVLLKHEARATVKQVVMKNSIFVLIVFSLLVVGLFGKSRAIDDRLFGGEFLNAVINNPQESLRAFLQWNGAVILPDYIFSNQDIQIAGFLFLLLLVIANKIKIKEGKVMVHVVSIIYFSFIAAMWFFFPFQVVGTNHRYLLVIFSAWCLSVGVITSTVFRRQKLFQNLVVVLLIVLILLQYYSLRATYKNWLLNGRDQKFIQAVHSQIISSVTLPLTKNDVIYLDFDDMSKDQSVVFGLGYKILVLSNTLNEDYFPNIYDNNIKDSKSLIVKSLNDKISKGLSKEDLIGRIFAFQFKDEIFKNTTSEFRKGLYSTE